jgi:4-diphosphocytidyl-2-C-methyl-D-erythritol kinase
MISFPNAKINLGLYVTEKRPDGFHNLETVFIPIDWKDALEFVEAPETQFTSSGLVIEGDPEQNLVMKAYRLLQSQYGLPALHIHLHKNIPLGAGLGGGSSDAAFMLKMLNEYFHLGLTGDELEQHAARLGSDCPFFVRNRPVFARGRGEIMEDIRLKISGLTLVVVKPPVHVTTALAFRNVIPQKTRISIKALVNFSVTRWNGNIKNQFEGSVFQEFPEIGKIKEQLYAAGAQYASMSGSGSAVFGIFEGEPDSISSLFPSDYITFRQPLQFR